MIGFSLKRKCYQISRRNASDVFLPEGALFLPEDAAASFAANRRSTALRFIGNAADHTRRPERSPCRRRRCVRRPFCRTGG